MEKVLSGLTRDEEQMDLPQGYEEQLELPPGFRFHPTDEELITHYLGPKVLDSSFETKAVGDVDLNKVEPWDLPWKAKMGEKEWYFFCVKDRKYPTGLRINRATDAGYWKATGKDKEIYKGKALVGMKKTLVFYKGRAPKGEKTNWVMHEYRLEGKNPFINLPKPTKNEWVLSRIFQKTAGGKKIHISGLLRYSDELQTSNLPPLLDVSRTDTVAAERDKMPCFSDQMEEDKVEDGFRDTLFGSSSSSKPFDISSSSSIFSSQFLPSFMGNLHYPDYLLMQDQSMLRLLLENNINGQNMKQSLKTELSQDTGLSTDISYEDPEFPIPSAEPLDLDSLWNY